MLFKKMLRDIRKHKTQFLSIFLMAFLGVFVFSGVGGESIGLEVNIDNYYEDTNLADGWIYSMGINDLFLYQVEYLGATNQMERQYVVDSVADFKNDPDVTLHFVENNTISKFFLLEGKTSCVLYVCAVRRKAPDRQTILENKITICFIIYHQIVTRLSLAIYIGLFSVIPNA